MSDGQREGARAGWKGGGWVGAEGEGGAGGGGRVKAPVTAHCRHRLPSCPTPPASLYRSPLFVRERIRRAYREERETTWFRNSGVCIMKRRSARRRHWGAPGGDLVTPPSSRQSVGAFAGIRGDPAADGAARGGLRCPGSPRLVRASRVARDETAQRRGSRTRVEP